MIESAHYESDSKTRNELAIERVEVPFTFKGKTEFKECMRIFVRPDGNHDEPDAQWDEHEDDELYSLNTLFNSYGKGDGTELRIKVNIDGKGEPEFFLNDYHPKPNREDTDERLPHVLISPSSAISDIALDLFYEIGGVDPPNGFKTRAKLESTIEEFKPNEDELESALDVLDEFGMPGDLPAHLYSLHDRLRSIFRKAKGLD